MSPVVLFAIVSGAAAVFTAFGIQIFLNRRELRKRNEVERRSYVAKLQLREQALFALRLQLTRAMTVEQSTAYNDWKNTFKHLFHDDEVAL